MDAPAPAVVAVIVSADPGPWFEETLASFAAQDCPGLSVLVIDSGGGAGAEGGGEAGAEAGAGVSAGGAGAGVGARVSAALPDAYVLRLDERVSFGKAANASLAAVEGATHLVLCHDDVAPEPDALRLMLEEAYRSNAGVVSPKLVSWQDAGTLLSVGMNMDRYAVPLHRVEPGELDQGQHDAVRDVAAAPGGCVLVRADLFREIGGYDEAIRGFGEGVDLSWRAHIAGARVVVAPAARVRHRQEAAGGARLQPSRASGFELWRRHEIRLLLGCCQLRRLAVVLPRLVLLNTAEVAWALATRRGGRARAIGSAWWWNMARWRDLLAKRHAVAAFRRVGDAELRSLLVSRVGRFVRYAEARGAREEAAWRSAAAAEAVGKGSGPRRGGVAESGEGFAWPAGDAEWAGGRPDEAAVRGSRAYVAAWAITLVVEAIGARNLLSQAMPTIGRFLPLPAISTLARGALAGWWPAGAGTTVVRPPAFGILALVETVCFGGAGLARAVLIGGSILAGLAGACHLARPAGRAAGTPPSRNPQTVALVLYASVPIAYNAVAAASFDALVAYAALPWITRRVLASFGYEPYASRAGGRNSAAQRARRAIGTGVLLALGVALAPSLVAPFALLAGVLAAASLLRTGLVAVGRGLAESAAAIGIAFALLAPWSTGIVAGWRSGSVGAGSGSAGPLGLERILTMTSGPVGFRPFGLLLGLACVVPLAVATGWRLALAQGAWAVAIGGVALAWVQGMGWTGEGIAPVGVWFAVVAVAVCLLGAAGAASFETELSRHRLGWRQALSLAAAACVVVAALPVLGAAANGRWDMASAGYEQSLPPQLANPSPRAAQVEVLWIGEAGVLPSASWTLGGGLAYATLPEGMPDVRALWLPPAPPQASIAGALRLAWNGGTDRVGRLLARDRIGFVIVASSGDAGPAAISASAVAAALDSQLDLRWIPSAGNVQVFANTVRPAAPPAQAAGRAEPASPPLTGARSAGIAGELLLMLVLAGCAVVLRDERNGSRVARSAAESDAR